MIYITKSKRKELIEKGIELCVIAKESEFASVKYSSSGAASAIADILSQAIIIDDDGK